MERCLISVFYIKPQHIDYTIDADGGCLISVFYIKPQLDALYGFDLAVVLYLFSTSNHNRDRHPPDGASVVLYLFSTSNHNQADILGREVTVVLYLFSTSNHNRQSETVLLVHVVLYLFSTSNHNFNSFGIADLQLSYICFLHQTTTYSIR